MIGRFFAIVQPFWLYLLEDFLLQKLGYDQQVYNSKNSSQTINFSEKYRNLKYDLTRRQRIDEMCLEGYWQ